MWFTCSKGKRITADGMQYLCLGNEWLCVDRHTDDRPWKKLLVCWDTVHPAGSPTAFMTLIHTMVNTKVAIGVLTRGRNDETTPERKKVKIISVGNCLKCVSNILWNEWVGRVWRSAGCCTGLEKSNPHDGSKMSFSVNIWIAEIRFQTSREVEMLELLLHGFQVCSVC